MNNRFIEHISELRKNLILIVIFFIISVMVSYFYSENIFAWLAKPFIELNTSKKLIYTGLSEAFFAYIKLSIFSASILTIPFAIWQLYKFVSPGLYKREKKSLLPYMIATPLLFWLGILFSYYIVFPMAWKFFISFEHNNLIPFSLEARVMEYIGISMHIMIAFGLAFEMPVFLMIMLKLKILSLDKMIKNRKYAIIIIFIISAIITPPDVASQVALAIPMILIYELVIIYGKINNRSNKNVRYKLDQK
jgi:sec-independent protein translocase protein TatC